MWPPTRKVQVGFSLYKIELIERDRL